VFEMAASLIIEAESGTYTARIRHPHNGYYAGDFSRPSRPVRPAPDAGHPAPVRVRDRTRQL
jgi:hypothetical protein